MISIIIIRSLKEKKKRLKSINMKLELLFITEFNGKNYYLISYYEIISMSTAKYKIFII